MKRRIWIGSSALGLLLLAGWTADDWFEVARNLEIFGKTYIEVNQSYVEEPNPTDMMRRGIEAMLASLDPYTNYYGESSVEQSRVVNAEEYSGIGASIGKRNGQILILELFQGGPADRGGLRVGDRILQVDETLILPERSLEEVNTLLQGEKNKPVTLLVQPQPQGQAQPVQITLLRGGAVVQRENVPFFRMVNDSVGYILLTGFMEDAGKEVGDALQSFKKEHPALRGLILDLRGNPGGRLDEAVNVCNVFLPPGEKIVEMKGRGREANNVFFTLRPPVDTSIRVAVLINGRSASASEIVSGALQDLDRAVVVGERSFGKGLVQNVRPLSYGAQMKITIAKYYTPSGRCVQAIDYAGKHSDGVPARTPDSLFQAFKTRRGRTVFDGGGVDPDLRIEKTPASLVLAAIESEGLLFEFVNQYVATAGQDIGPVASFRVSDELYASFGAFLRARNFTFSTESDRQLEALLLRLAEDRYDTALEAQVNVLRRALEEMKTSSLERYEGPIRRALRSEIVNRYHYKQGVIESSFGDDPYILEALGALASPQRYGSLLGKSR